MNKILLSSGNFDLERYTSPAKLVVSDDTTLNAINISNNLELDIEVKDNTKLVLNLFNFDDSIEHNIKISSYDNASVVLNVSFIAIKEYKLNIDSQVNGNNSLNDVNIRGINEGADVLITLNGTLADNCIDSTINEYAKVINTSDMSNTLIPNLIVNNNEIVANHGISIGSIDEEELFYLMTKGISKNEAIKLIEEGFILSIMDESLKARIKNILLGR